jgi:hypothetical protein
MLAALLLAGSLLVAPQGPRIDDLHRATLPLAGQEVAAWGFAHDSWAPADDKLLHFAAGFMTTTLSAWAFKDETPAERRGILGYNALGWILWEVKDGFGGWRRSRWLGEGASIPDAGYALLGCLLAMAIR